MFPGTFNMALAGSPTYVSDGLVLHIDAKTFTTGDSTVSDVEGSGRTMTVNGGVTKEASDGGRFDFSGGSSNEYLSTSNSGLGTGKIPYTFEIWCNFDKVETDRWWLAVIGAYSGGNVHMIGTSNGDFGTWDYSSQRISLTSLASPGTWQQIVLTNDGANTFKVYQNGLIFATKTNNTNHNLTSTALNIANNGGYSVQDFDGKVTIARLYNRALTDEEVQKNYKANKRRHGLS
jgi:hypothetical protein